ncbi:alpha/beta hydrolase family protein [Saccharothrix sp. HUAS TT1]|uniref:alpha/beta hydrolase family protein n=1 Tax=unclassified Saccharothrix TaxID=2593673 RepID=UPI00345B6131
MRSIRLLLPVLLAAALVAPVTAQAQPTPQPLPTGWAIDGARLTWTAPAPVPPGGAAIEFWDGDRLLGVPRPSADLRTHTLDAVSVADTDGLQVRASGRRLDVEEPVRPSTAVNATPPALQPAGDTDPGTPGRFATRTGEYELDPIAVSGYPVPLEMKAVVVAPTGAPGRRPLALFLHGRHATCYNGAALLLEWPCPEPAEPVPSHRGYLQAQRLLASQGYVTVSVSANAVNAHDVLDVESGAGARSALVRAHLARWADWAGAGRGSAPDVVRAAPVADLDEVFLVGHSRGGEGVNRAAVDSLTPPPGEAPARWRIRGALLIGPTIFGHNPAPDVPSVTILPGCDGDVSDLQGQLFVDATRGVSRGTALHSALYFVGANHNFFNTEWTPGQAEAPAHDDFRDTWVDAVCSPGTATRLTAEQQQTAAATYIAAAARLFVAGDRRVLPLLDGSGVRAPSADPARVLSHAVGGARSPFVVPDAATSAGGSAAVCDPVSTDPAAACVDPSTARPSPHFVRFNRVPGEPGRFAVALRWSADGQAATVRPGAPVSLAGARQLALRLAVPPNTAANRFDVALTDVNGRRARLGSVSLDGLPATERLSARWAQEVRVPLPAHGVDLRRVAELELVPHGGAGQAWLIDAHGWAPGLPDPRPVALPRVDVGALTVEEGDSGVRTVRFPVSVTGDGAGSVRVFVQDEEGVAYTGQVVAIEPGQHEVAIPVRITGNTRWNLDAKRVVLVKAVRGVVVGRYTDRLTVSNDDPEPTFTATPVTDAVTEGGTLTWRVTLSAPADRLVVVQGRPVAPEGPELSTTDVDELWFRRNVSLEEPLPSRPLSTTRVQPIASFQRGEVSALMIVPTVVDAEVEPVERITLNLSVFSSRASVSGAVTDGAPSGR